MTPNPSPDNLSCHISVRRYLLPPSLLRTDSPKGPGPAKPSFRQRLFRYIGLLADGRSETAAHRPTRGRSRVVSRLKILFSPSNASPSNASIVTLTRNCRASPVRIVRLRVLIA